MTCQRLRDMFSAAVRRGVAPDAVWRLSLREWRWLVATTPKAKPGLSQAEFAALQSALEPDAGAESHNGR